MSADGIRTCRIVCQRVVPRASDPVRSSCGIARKASYETLVIVGTIMIERTREPASHENPVRKPGIVMRVPTTGSPRLMSLPKVLLRNGTRIVIPSQPQTTLGMPTKISSAGWTIARAHCGATSERKRARPTETGVEISSATTVTKTVPAMKGSSPKLTFGLVMSGCQVDEKIWLTGTPSLTNSWMPCQAMNARSRATMKIMEAAAASTTI